MQTDDADEWPKGTPAQNWLDKRAAIRQASVTATAQQGSQALEIAHGYRRDDDGSVLVGDQDLLVLHSLLFARVLARKDSDYAAADHVRRELEDASVLVFDRDLTFKVVQARQPREPRAPPTAHDYRRADDGSVLLSPDDQRTLDGLLLERLRAKFQRDFDRADALREALKQHNVFINDGERTYQVRAPRAPRPPRESNDGPSTHDYRRGDDGSIFLSPEQQALVDGLLLERLRAKFKRDFDSADALRETLKQHDVFVDDRERTYEVRAPRASPGRQNEPERDYARDENDASGVVLAPADEAQLAARLAARRAAKRIRDYSSADAIRSELDGVATACGCRLLIDDKKLTYRFELGTTRRVARRTDDADDGGHGYRREDDGCRLRDDIAAIDALLNERVRAKRCRDFHKADELRTELRNLGVFVDDKKRTFYCREKPDEAGDYPDDGATRVWELVKPKNDRAGLGRAGGGKYGRVPPPPTGPMQFVRSSSPSADALPPADDYKHIGGPLDLDAPLKRARDRSRSRSPPPPRRSRDDDGFPDF